MHEDAPTLTATPREKTGSRYAARVREAGGLPAVVYGHGEPPMAVTVDAKETIRLLRKGEKIFQLRLEGVDTPQNVLVKELQFDHLGTDVVHADFARVDLEERVDVRVPVHLVGEARGLKKVGSILMHPTNEVEIECKLANMPSFIEVDISELDANEAIHAGDITLPLPTMVLRTDPASVIAQIVIQAEEAETDEETTVEGAAEPEVITEKKEEDEASED
jgi:large subunit ribosomal protein L25